MKIRKGFVSNSSSSSFVIATKGEKDDEKIKRLVLDAFKVDPESPIFYLIEQAAEVMATVEETDIDEISEYYGDFVKKAIKEGFTSFYMGSADSQTEGAEAMLCDLDIHYSDNDIKIEKDGGY